MVEGQGHYDRLPGRDGDGAGMGRGRNTRFQQPAACPPPSCPCCDPRATPLAVARLWRVLWPNLWLRSTGGYLQMNRLSLRTNRLKFKTAGKLPTVSEEFLEYTPIS